MNFLTIIAFGIAIAIFMVTVLTSTKDPSSLIDMHGILIVIGGTISATAISFRLDRILLMFKIFFNRVIRSQKINYVDVIKELMNAAEVYRKTPEQMNSHIDSLKDPFMKEALTLLTEGILEHEDRQRVLLNRVNTVYQRYSGDAKQFQAMGKFPPAMGLLGAVLGMVALLASLGEEGAEERIGPAMSVALVATFYGIALANFLIIPIAENLTESAREIRVKNFIIVEGVKLISQKKNAIVVAEELNSFLLASERIDWKTAGSKNAKEAA